MHEQDEPQVRGSRRTVLRLLCVLSLIVGVLAVAAPASAQESSKYDKKEATAKPAPVEGETHCVVELIQQTDGKTVGQQDRGCFDTLAKAQQVARFGNLSDLGAQAFSSGSNWLGTHYKNRNYSGSSITISGTTCSGGVWKPTGSWNNNIESTISYCGGATTRFYNSSSCGGSHLPLNGSSSSLYWMNNLTSCVRYG